MGMDNIVSVDGHLSSSINFAMQQNYVPVIRNLFVNNESDEVLENLDLIITFEPEFAKEYCYHIDSIQPHGSVEISPVKITTNTDFLFSLTEKMIGSIVIEVMKGDEKLFTYDNTIELLAYDQWSGLLIMPEIIAAFVTPNHPAVTDVIRSASASLKEWDGSPSFTGYQTNNPDKVKKQMAAIYVALAHKQIVYNNPPASYEVIGQRIRLPHLVLEQKIGTCLDLTVLYASCLEAVGLDPLLFFISGHAFCGCWLEDNTFADCVVDDVSAIEKRIASGAEEMLLVECTDLVDGSSSDFERSLKHGKDHIQNADQFNCVIDIRRSRGSGIRPIPLRPELSYTGAQINENSEKPRDSYVPTKLDSSLLGRVAEGTDQPLTKMRMWERKLLDFSLRNSLLNFRLTKSTIKLMTADLGKLEDNLADGKDFRIMEMPSELNLSLRNAKMFGIENDNDLITSIADSEFKSGRIRTYLPEREFESTLKNLYRSAKVSMEENGSNTLFLALGLLRWYESDLSEKERHAPLVLLPIDIVRNTRNKGYVIRSRQEDSQINVTLLEYLRQDHGVSINGLDPLPLDDHGIDLPLIFNTVRQAVMGKKRWNVEEAAFIGLFSFSQFVMWNDLRNRSGELEKNKVVSSLIKGSLTWKPDKISISPENLDTEFDMSSMAVPLSADSSQLTAIAAAGMGQSFVLHGPPGTGKSQTITNMIANALYNGKSVLFVAEKMAALNVVQKRLAGIGLDPFCLELHSNKTNKSSVLAELDKALEVGRIKSPDDYEAEAEKLNKQREKLNGIISALHDKRKCGISLYEAVAAFESNFAEQGRILFDKNYILGLSKADIENNNELVRQYRIAVSEIGTFSEHPLKNIGLSSYSIEKRDEFIRSAKSISEKTEKAKADIDLLCQAFGYSGNMDRSAVLMLIGIYRAYTMQGNVLTGLMSAANNDAISGRLKALIETGREYKAACDDMSESFEKTVFDYAVSDAVMRRKQAETSWFLPKAMGISKLVKELKLHAKDPSDVTKENLAELHDRLCVISEKKENIRSYPSDITGVISGIFMNEQTDWEELEISVAKTEAVMSAIHEKGISSSDMALKMSSALSSDVQNAGRELSEFIALIEGFEKEFAVCDSLADTSENWLDEVSRSMALYTENGDKLRDMVAFNQADNALCESGLSCVSSSYRSGNVTADNLEAAYACGLNYDFALMIIKEDERLSAFSGRSYDDLISRFKKTIDRFSLLTMQEVAARLSAKIPEAGSSNASSSEMGILKRAIKSGGRMMSLRSLFDKIPNLLRRLCPCMLMSPISVAQYIDPSFPKFDLVIFDEASQLPTSEAVGTIARGENVIIVGDPKQLPPTNFFSTNRIDEENSDKEDLESLLDDCLAVSMPQQYLKWHYRSRHESLIAYSNMKYYDNKLLTFPSPNDLVSEVKIIHPDGFYDKGKTKQNKAEARAVVDEIIRRLSDEELRNESIGVVTFSSVQQNLIDDMLCEELAKHPELEDLDRKSAEPVFIKNLENVQGDERDVILFSVGYGPDQNGNVSMNFGPLNRDGGWRRLNVAISRARKSMVVYSVLRPEQIDLSRTRSEGVAGLKGFLEFAERGRLAVIQRVGSAAGSEDSVPMQIAEAVSEMGYKVKCSIGSSEFKVDIGVIDPANEDTYLLGIMLDGENCRNSSNARDRFVLQPSVLGGLGWNVIRVWTLDWLDDRERVLKSIRTAIENVPAKPAAEAKPMPHPEISFERERKPQTSSSVPYNYGKITIMGRSDDFLLPQNRNNIKRGLRHLIDSEAPISRKLLMKKVFSEWGIVRVSSKAETVFNEVLESFSAKSTFDGGREFIWKVDQIPADYSCYRIDDADKGRRSIDEIPSEEILNAIYEVLREQISISETDLIRETAKKFGYSRLGGVIESTVGYAVKKGVSKRKLIRSDNGSISLSE